jgi:hypothetical protein
MHGFGRVRVLYRSSSGFISESSAVADGLESRSSASCRIARLLCPQQAHGWKWRRAGFRAVADHAVRASATAPGHSPQLAQSRAARSSIWLTSC